MMPLKLFLATLVAFLAIDGVWLGVVAKNWYAQALGPLMRNPANLWAAGLFYLLYAVGIVFLILIPAQKQHFSLWQVAASAFLFGVVAYGTYDLTNLAVLKNWPVVLSFVDMLWGGALTASVSTLVFALLL